MFSLLCKQCILGYSQVTSKLVYCRVMCLYSDWSLITYRISHQADGLFSGDQAGFRRCRSTCDQVAALTTHIENGFQSNLKTGAVFLDLTAAYDTVWHTGLLCKLAKCMEPWFVNLIDLLIRNRRFRIHVGDDISHWHIQVNGLPQGSVLSPTVQPVHEWPASQLVPQVHLRRWHLLCLPSQIFYWNREHTLSRLNMPGRVLSTVAFKAKHDEDCH